MIASPAPSVVPRRLVAVVVTYNRLDKLKVTLARLLDSPAEELAQVVVVNNASTDGTADWLETQDNPRLDIRTSATNSGGAGGFESGMRHAMETHRPDWLVVMDDDGRPEPGALAAFHALPEGKWDAVAAAVYFPSGEICEMNRPSRNPFWSLPQFWRTLRKGRNGFHIPHAAYQEPACAIDVTSFVGFFISRAAVEQVGYPDADLFIYGDDSIYTLELSRQGSRIGFVPDIRFEHDFTTFVDADSGQRFRPLWKVYYHHRNLLLLYQRAAGWLFWLVLPVVLLKWLSKVRHHAGVRGRYLALTGLAVWDGLQRRRSRAHSDILRRAGEG
ncbi:Glycosyltransferase, GT2 family [Epibacterium ulvae]|uniref:Glycosyltransferase, GT2 family n=1 Tax=Epibacterium ulvae TaxID=1156985 RepID=A0A1G5RD19_9RHOB|nr:glycosyltransferase family 2 protein [Epibacterium ulvae]SCZ71973.1 Glycosyltransferase, GT2 family [Epibacterium ulvae]